MLLKELFYGVGQACPVVTIRFIDPFDKFRGIDDLCLVAEA